MFFKRKDKLSGDYDVIVIGSGLGGMTAANRLAKLNRKVLLLEAHNKLGGLATWFYRQNKRHTFDISLHGFPYSMIKTCRKYWNQKIADHIVQVKDIRFINPQFKLKTTFSKDHYITLLREHFNIKPEVIDQFFACLSQMNFFDDHSLTNKELFERFFPGRNDVVRFLMEAITYANGSDLMDPAITYGIVFNNFMNRGVYTFKGGTENVIKMMKEEMLDNNVDIKLLSKVEKITVEDKKVRGVIVNGQEIRGQTVISNSGIRQTVFDLVGKPHFGRGFLQKVYSVRQNSSSCQIYIGIKKNETIPQIGELIFTSDYPVYDWEKILAFKTTSRTFSIYYPELRPDLAGQTSIVCSTNTLWSDWKDLTKEQYLAKKREMIEETISALEKLIPTIRKKIDYVEAATPKTVKKFTHHEMGSSFGTKFEGLEVSKELPQQIEGLYHAGSVGIIMSGWLGAANYGVIVANEIESYFHNQIGHRAMGEHATSEVHYA